MLQQYHSELGEKALYNDTARYIPFINKWAVRTQEELKGKGIKFWKYEESGEKRKCYHVTQKAFDKLCKTMDISQELLFD